MITIGVIKETFGLDYGKPERRVALVPSDAKKLIELGFKVIIEKGAGVLANYVDDDYKKVGVEITNSPEDVIRKSDIVTKVKQWTIKEIATLQRINPFNKKTYLMSFFDWGLISLTSVDILLLTNFQIVKTAALDAMSRISGEEMTQRALKKYSEIHAKQPDKVAILGAGNAGKAAIKKALSSVRECEVFVRNIDKAKLDLGGDNSDRITINDIAGIANYLKSISKPICLISTLKQREGIGDYLFSLDDLRDGSVVIDINPYKPDTFIDGIKPTTGSDFEITDLGVYFYSIHNYPCYAEGASNAFSKANFEHLLATSERVRDNGTTKIETVNLKEIKKVLDDAIRIYSKYLNETVEGNRVGDFIIKDLESHKVSLSDLARELLYNCRDVNSAIGIIKNHVLGQYLMELSKTI